MKDKQELQQIFVDSFSQENSKRLCRIVDFAEWFYLIDHLAQDEASLTDFPANTLSQA